MVKKMAKSAGWSGEWTKKLGEMDDKQEEEFPGTDTQECEGGIRR